MAIAIVDQLQEAGKNKRSLIILLAALVCLVHTGCATFYTSPSPTQLPAQTSCPSIERGLDFLSARYNPGIGLLNESPVTAPDAYWLTNDNALAALAFSQLDRPELAVAVTTAMQRYGFSTNGLVEVIWGAQISFPPYVARQDVVAKANGAEIWQEFHTSGPKFEDWSQYADLGFLGALNEFRWGRIPEAHTIYANTLGKFDGRGFQDKAFNGQYETYKLALALYVSATIQAPIPNAEKIGEILLSMQAGNGGFYTHYRALQTPEGDTNTETTAYALLAQAAYGCLEGLSEK